MAAELEGREYPPGQVWECQDLYVIDGLSYARVATLTGVAPSTLKRWGEKYGWAEKRDKLRLAQSEIRVAEVALRQTVLKKCLDTAADNPMDVFAAAKLAEVALAARKLALEERATGSPWTQDAFQDGGQNLTMAEAITRLEEALTRKVALFLRDAASLDVAALKGVRDGFTILGQWRADAGMGKKDGRAQSGQSGQPGGLSREQVAALTAALAGDTRAGDAGSVAHG